jgi:DNA modification methylase
MQDFTLHHNDCLEVLRTMEPDSIDAIVTDPPYGLGFMGKEWDSLPPGREVFEECLRVLKPGGHLLAFGGTRTYHRLVVAIEDAGFEIRDMISWLYGSGFPKSHDVAKGIDAANGAKGTVTPTGNPVKRIIPGADQDKTGSWIKDNGRTYQPGEYEPATEAARQWDGWGTALKPACEPICMARKPLAGTVAQNVQAHGTGALNIDGCRVPTDDDLNGGACAENGGRGESVALRAGSGMNVPGKTVGKPFEQPPGRWPANVIHDGSDEVLAGFPAEAKAGGNVRGTEPSAVTAGIYGEFEGRVPFSGFGDSGSAARFFYCAKASKADRDEGLDHIDEAQFVQWQTGNGASGKPSSMSEGRDTRRRNIHPTVKPVDLMRYLCRLVTPPGGLILDPFMGSGSTGKAAILEGFRFVGIERQPEYMPLAEGRIRWALEEAARVKARGVQLSMFSEAAE